MATENLNGKQPAFPTTTDCGLTKREWFAGLVMQAYCSQESDGTSFEMIAANAIRQADALLRALEESEVGNG